MKPCWMSIVSGVGIWVLTLCSGLARAQSTPAADGFACVDITGVANRALRDSIAGDGRGGWLDQGSNDMRFLPVGRQEFLGIPFGIIEGREEACLVLQGPQPEGAAELKAINKKARSIYFLHTAAWAKKGDPGAVYTVLYEDGSKAEIPIRAGIEINDWWDPKDGKNCRVAWVGPSLTSSRVGVHLYPWPNPHPERNISAIRFASGDGKMVPIVLAVTLSDRPARLPESIVAAQEAERQEQNEAEKLEFAPGQAAMLGRKRFVGPVLQEDLLPPLTPGKDAYTPASQPHSFAYLRQYGGMHNPEKLPIGGAADVSFLNEKPAGKHGYLRVKDGKLVFEDGTPARFLSVGLTYGIMFPSTMEEARQRARWLAANGINMVRLHHFTYSGKEGASLFDFYEGADEDFRKQHGPTNRRWRNTRKYDREAWNKLDMLLAALKEEGIYVHLSAIVFPWIGDIEAAEKNIPPRGRGYDAYRTEGAQLFISEYEQKVNRLWHDLLEHKNPYTHLRHVDDPAIAGVELVNEDSIFWRGCDPDRLSAYYSMELHELWNRWLLKKYGSTEALRKAWGPDVMEDWEELISDVNSMKEGRQVPQPKRFEKAPQGFTPCDLSSAVNTTYRDIYGGDGKDGWFDSGKDDDMRFFPTGRNVYLGVPFLVSDKGPILIADKESFPDVGKGKGKRPNPRKANLWPTHARLPVAGKAGSVYFLHTAGWLPKGNAPVFHYEVEYADGTKLDIPIRSNEEISDWSHPRNSERMRVAWRGSCYSGNVGINLYAWDNPHPETPITGITARIEGNPAVVCILGVTLSDSPAKLVPISDVPVLPEWARYVRLWPYASRFTEDGWNEALLKRASDQIRFLYEVQTGYFLDQKKFLQEEIGFKGLVLGSNWKTPPLMREADRYSDAQLDILDQHNYGSSNGFMRAPGSGTFTAGQHRVLGKPMMISEWYPARVEPYPPVRLPAALPLRPGPQRLGIPHAVRDPAPRLGLLRTLGRGRQLPDGSLPVPRHGVGRPSRRRAGRAGRLQTQDFEGRDLRREGGRRAQLREQAPRCGKGRHRIRGQGPAGFRRREGR